MTIDEERSKWEQELYMDEERYMRATGLFPPGRSIPAAVCGGPSIDEYREAAFRFWRLLQRARRDAGK